jgi:hypothetical protein
MNNRATLSDAEIAAAMIALLGEREAGKSICPSEVPRRLLGEDGPWRSWLTRTRQVAARLAGEGRVIILRHGKPVSAEAMRGVIRLARGPNFDRPPEAE